MRRTTVFFFLIIAVAVVAAHSSYALGTDTFQITGIVVNANDGSPLGKCQVMIQPALAPDSNPQSSQAAPKSMTITTGEDGRFVFNNVAEAKYSLVARRIGFRTQALDEHDEFTSAVAVGQGKDSQNIIFRLQPAASITGRIEDEFGDPVANGQVMLFRRGVQRGKMSTYPRAGTHTSNDGVYHFYRLPPGEYFLAVIAKPWYTQYRQHQPPQGDDRPVAKPEEGEANLDVGFPVTYYSGALDSKSANPIQLHPGDRFTADIRLNAQAAFDLKTRDTGVEESKPVQSTFEGAVFDVQMSLDQTVMRANDNGQATQFLGVPAGRYRLRQRVMAEGGVANERRQEVDISADGNVEYRKPAEGTPVKGTITLEGSTQPLRDTIIQLDKRDGNETVQARSNAKGELVPFQLFPGQYQYSAFSRQGVIKSFAATGAKVRGRTIEVGSTPVNLSVIMADVAVAIEGTVLSKDGKPTAGAMVVLIPEDPDFNQNIFRRDQSDSDGTFVLRVVMPGKYTLVAIQDGWTLEWSKVNVMRRFLPYGEAIEVRPGQNIKTKVNIQSARD